MPPRCLVLLLLGSVLPAPTSALSGTKKVALEREQLQRHREHDGSGHRHLHIDLGVPHTNLALHQRAGDRRQAPTTVETKSWFSRMWDSLMGVLIALFVIIPCSISLLWVNERRNAQLEALLGLGRKEVETVPVDQGNLAEYDGMLVHLDSGTAQGKEKLQDARFPTVRLERGCIRLKSVVEVYQWEEQIKEKTTKNNVGGGTTTTKEASYAKSWSMRKIDSSTFQDRSGSHKNHIHVKDVEVGTREEVNDLVMYGEQYRMPTDLVTQLSNWEDARGLVGEKVAFQNYKFAREKDSNWYQCPVHGDQPEIGDVRVKFMYVLDGPATVLALQMSDAAKGVGGGHTFGPYRSIPRGFCCGTREGDMKKELIRSAGKDSAQIYQEEKCMDFGPFYCLCAYCNLVTRCFSAGMQSQLYSAWSGKVSQGGCFASEAANMSLKKWLIRGAGWILLWIGFNFVLDPLSTILDIIPFLGPVLSSGVSWIVGLVTFLLAALVGTVIISIAYLMYHPLVGLFYTGITAGLVALIVLISNTLSTNPGAVPVGL